MKTKKYKLRYEVDPFNRLVITRPSGPASLPRRKLVLDGKFSTPGDNTLEFEITTPEPGLADWLPAPAPEGTPHKIRFEGNWSLTRGHDLRFTLRKSAVQEEGDSLVLTGGIVSASGGQLMFSVTTGSPEGPRVTKTLKLTGSWQADPRNRLSFLVERKKQEPDTLVFSAAWEIDENYSITYRHERTQLKKRLKVESTFTLKGAWRISSRKQLSFLVGAGEGSRFDFSAALETPQIRAKEGEVRYRIGIGTTAGRRAVRKLVFFGKWRINKDLSVDFEFVPGDGRKQAFHFDTEYVPSPGNKIILSLKSREGARLGIEVTFMRSFFEDAEVFIRFRNAAGEKAIEGGLRLPF